MSYLYPVMNKEKSCKGGADLHLHTNFSDGTYSVERLVRTAKEVGLETIAVTDHDSVGALDSAEILGKKYGVKIVPGIELSCAQGKSELHILGYFVGFRDQAFRAALLEVQNTRKERMAVMIGKLREIGISISSQDFFDSVTSESVSRLHLADYLQKNRLVTSRKEAFQRFIGDKRPAHINVNAFTLKSGIEFILKSGGVPVYAHPAVTGRDDLIPEMIEYGLKGIEVFNTSHSAESVRKYAELAKSRGLLVSGGSDCHGLNKSETLIGKVRLPEDNVERIRAVHMESTGRP